MKRVSKSALFELLDALGVGAGDRLCVHCFMPSLGIVEGGLPGTCDAIREKIGPTGTLIVPTFTSSYRRGEVYDVLKSHCFNGAFSEHVRQRDGAIRSLDPLFSMAAIGPDAAWLMERRSKNCFGSGSVYDTLFEHDVKYVMFGVDWDQGYSFFMHLERLAEVPYRRDEIFVGVTRDADGRAFEDKAVHFVRVSDIPWHRRRGPVGRQLVEAGIIREVVSNGCTHRVMDSAPLAEAMAKRFAADPWCMTDRAA